jgi:hypothetical protein
MATRKSTSKKKVRRPNVPVSAIIPVSEEWILERIRNALGGGLSIKAENICMDIVSFVKNREAPAHFPEPAHMAGVALPKTINALRKCGNLSEDTLRVVKEITKNSYAPIEMAGEILPPFISALEKHNLSEQEFIEIFRNVGTRIGWAFNEKTGGLNIGQISHEVIAFKVSIPRIIAGAKNLKRDKDIPNLNNLLAQHGI